MLPVNGVFFTLVPYDPPSPPLDFGLLSVLLFVEGDVEPLR